MESRQVARYKEKGSREGALNEVRDEGRICTGVTWIASLGA